MTQPLNRNCWLPQLGEIDHEAGEFWVENPFVMQQRGMNLGFFAQPPKKSIRANQHLARLLPAASSSR